MDGYSHGCNSDRAGPRIELMGSRQLPRRTVMGGDLWNPYPDLLPATARGKAIDCLGDYDWVQCSGSRPNPMESRGVESLDGSPRTATQRIIRPPGQCRVCGRTRGARGHRVRGVGTGGSGSDRGSHGPNPDPVLGDNSGGRAKDAQAGDGSVRAAGVDGGGASEPRAGRADRF